MTKPMKYKVGDKVRVRSDLQIGTRYGACTFASGMVDYKGKIVTISETDINKYCVRGDEEAWVWTDEMFEGLAEDELTAEEVIILYSKMCGSRFCEKCKLYEENNETGFACRKFMREHPDKVIEILKDYEKKEIETEFVYLIRVMKEEGDSSTCIYTYEVKEDKDDIDEKMDELVKQYYEENGGKIYAKCERICRVKS